LYAEFNVGTARQMYLGAKVRMRAEHAVETRGVFDRVFRGVRDEEVVVEEGVVVTSSSLEMLTNSCLGGIMVSLIFLEELEKEALAEFMVELFEEDDKKREGVLAREVTSLIPSLSSSLR
nr:hypothetical protein [Tanacetum cinerariifolium]